MLEPADLSPLPVREKPQKQEKAVAAVTPCKKLKTGCKKQGCHVLHKCKNCGVPENLHTTQQKQEIAEKKKTQQQATKNKSQQAHHHRKEHQPKAALWSDDENDKDDNKDLDDVEVTMEHRVSEGEDEEPAPKAKTKNIPQKAEKPHGYNHQHEPIIHARKQQHKKTEKIQKFKSQKQKPERQQQVQDIDPEAQLLEDIELDPRQLQMAGGEEDFEEEEIEMPPFDILLTGKGGRLNPYAKIVFRQQPNESDLYHEPKPGHHQTTKQSKEPKQVEKHKEQKVQKVQKVEHRESEEEQEKEKKHHKKDKKKEKKHKKKSRS
jgi:hypothetical protein